MATYGYIRVSELRPGQEKFSPAAQRSRIREAAESRGLGIPQFFEDLDVNSASIARKGTWHKLVKSLSKGDTVIVNEGTRLGRNTRDTLGRVDELKVTGASLIALDLPYAPDCYMGEFITTILAAAAQMENSQRAERVRQSHVEIAKVGKWPGGNLPHGYRFVSEDDHTIEVAEEKAATVREIFELSARGNGRTSIAKGLNRQGIPSPTGKPWHPTSVAVLLANRAYIGERTFQGEVYPAAIPPLITRALWDRAHAAIIKSPTPKRPKYLMSGLLTCELCGKGMVHKPRVGGTAPQYECYGRRAMGTCKGVAITHHLVEAAVLEQFFTHVESDPDDYVATSSAWKFAEAQSPELTSLRKRLTDAQQQHDRILGLYQDGKIDRGAFERRADPLEAQAREIEREIGMIEAGNVLPPTWDGNIREDWEILSADERRHALDLFIERVVIEPGNGKRGAERVKIEWR